MEFFVLNSYIVSYRLTGTSSTPSRPGKRQSVDPAVGRGKSRRRWL